MSNKSEATTPELHQIDTVLHGGRYIDVRTGRIVQADIALAGGEIVGLYPRGFARLDELTSNQKIDVTGKVISPGFINTHLHIESSLITPQEYDRMTLPRGTTTIMWDPHEIANVKGTIAFDFALASAEQTIQDLFFCLSSCVPAVSHLGTSGASIIASDMKPYMDKPYVLGLAEMMNIGGVMNDDPDVMAKLDLFKGRYIGGHLPLVMDDAVLQKYRDYGVRDDHESITAQEAEKKLRYGFNILIREGTAARNLEALADIIKPENDGRIAFCTDDRHPDEVLSEGEVDYIIRKAISLYDAQTHGEDKQAYIIRVYSAATLWAAQNFNLVDRGAVEVGLNADLVILDDIEKCTIDKVLKDGVVVTPHLFEARQTVDPKQFGFFNSIRFKNNDVVTADTFKVASDKLDNGSDIVSDKIPVIKIIPNQIVTEVAEENLPLDPDNNLLADTTKDVLKMAVLERHGKNGAVGLGFVQGFGLKNGAIASSVGHDDHNVIVAGSDDDQMAQAVNHLKEIGGGFVLVHQGEVTACQPLPVAGLMSDKPWEEVAKIQTEFLLACQKAGFTVKDPTMSLAFLALPVIPDIKLTDRGYTRFAPDDGYPVPQFLKLDNL